MTKSRRLCWLIMNMSVIVRMIFFFFPRHTEQNRSLAKFAQQIWIWILKNVCISQSLQKSYSTMRQKTEMLNETNKKVNARTHTWEGTRRVVYFGVYAKESRVSIVIENDKFHHEEHVSLLFSNTTERFLEYTLTFVQYPRDRLFYLIISDLKFRYDDYCTQHCKVLVRLVAFFLYFILDSCRTMEAFTLSLSLFLVDDNCQQIYYGMSR